MIQTSFDVIYRNVPHQQVNELLEFRSTHPVQQRSIDGMEWNYILSGTGSKTILLMSGPLSTPEMVYRSILNLEKDYRVLSLSYSLYNRIDTFTDGLIKLLDLEGIERFHLIGASLGAGIGHVLVRHHPIGEISPLKDRVDKLVLSTFGLYTNKKISQVKQLVRLFNFLPYWITRKYLIFSIAMLLKGIDKSDRLLPLAHHQDILTCQNNKQTLIAQYQMVVDLFENSSYDLDIKIDNSSILIIETQDDASIDRDEQAALRQTYPNAKIHLFETGGHLREITHRDEYDAIIREFLELDAATVK
jgi:pimeloyl-ACP methyl ester carboxylesterase